MDMKFTCLCLMFIAHSHGAAILFFFNTNAVPELMALPTARTVYCGAVRCGAGRCSVARGGAVTMKSAWDYDVYMLLLNAIYTNSK